MNKIFCCIVVFNFVFASAYGGQDPDHEPLLENSSETNEQSLTSIAKVVNLIINNDPDDIAIFSLILQTRSEIGQIERSLSSDPGSRKRVLEAKEEKNKNPLTTNGMSLNDWDAFVRNLKNTNVNAEQSGFYHDVPAVSSDLGINSKIFFTDHFCTLFTELQESTEKLDELLHQKQFEQKQLHWEILVKQYLSAIKRTLPLLQEASPPEYGPYCDALPVAFCLCVTSGVAVVYSSLFGSIGGGMLCLTLCCEKPCAFTVVGAILAGIGGSGLVLAASSGAVAGCLLCNAGYQHWIRQTSVEPPKPEIMIE